MLDSEIEPPLRIREEPRVWPAIVCMHRKCAGNFLCRMDREVMQSNVTLKIDETLLKQARKLAVEEDTSLSAWVAGLIGESLRKRANYQAARTRALARMEKGFALASGRFTREDLHER